MRHIFLLRHAKSSWDDPAQTDFDRPLNARGRRNAFSMAEYLNKTGIRPDRILCSAAQRTRETLEILSPRLQGVPVLYERGLYETDLHGLLMCLRHQDDSLHSLMVIGHNPGLEHLTEYLSAGQGDALAQDRLIEKYPTGTLAVLETDCHHWRGLQQECCRLTAFIRPADLD